MAIYHCSAKIIGRSSGRSAVASAAYRAGEKIKNERDGVLHDYSRRRGVVYKEIILPHDAPLEYYDRKTLWNAVEFAEKRCDAQTAREVEVALPYELNLQEDIALLREFIDKNFVDLGMCADFAVHNKGDNNPHAHILLTMREVSERGFGKKNRDWNHPKYLERWREDWERCVNKRLQERGIDERIDHRTLEAQGLDREPTIHVGHGRGRKAREAKNQEIISRNHARSQRRLQEQERALDLVRKIEPIEEPVKNIDEEHISNERMEIAHRNLERLHESERALGREIYTLNAENIVRKQEVQNLARKMESFEEHLKNIAEINAEIMALGYSRQTRDRIRALENRREQAELYIQRRFGVTPDRALEELKKMKEAERELNRAINNPELARLVEQRITILRELERLEPKRTIEKVPDRVRVIERSR